MRKIDDFIDELEKIIHIIILLIYLVGLSIFVFKLFYYLKITEEKDVSINQLNNKNCEKTVEIKII